MRLIGRRRKRFEGAGGSAMRKFRAKRMENIRAQRWDWTFLVVTAPAFAALSWYADDRLLQFVGAALFGVFLMMGVFAWMIGGHASALPWLWGVEGERRTGAALERLGPDWHCEHDIEHEHGNWDHVLVGPPGVFLLDSKALNNPARVEDDALCSGRLRYKGGAARGGARTIHHALLEQFRHPLWVQSVVVVWGDLGEERREDNPVYLCGESLVPWLSGLEDRLGRPQRAAAIEALRVVRESMASGEWISQPMGAHIDLDDKEAVRRALDQG